MRWKKAIHGVHRWIGLAVSLQLLAWSVGGLMFTVLDIDDVHGDFERNMTPPPVIPVESVVLTPADAAREATEAGLAVEAAARIELRQRWDRTVYLFFDQENQPLGAVDAGSGEVTARISADQARAAALADFAPHASVISAEFLEGVAPSEFRGGAMPVYRVVLDHPKQPHIYVSPVTGQVLKHRNKPWRLFDFFWMLHIMDYNERDNFNHPLLTAMASLAVLTATTGLWMWWWRMPRRRHALSKK